MRNIMLAATAIAGFGILAAGSAQAQMPAQGISTPNFANPMFSGSFPEPGTVNVYLKTRLITQMGYGSDSLTVQKAGTNGFVGVKTSGVQIQEYVRIYPGFDGKTNGGLEYGAALEIRQENASNAQSNNNPASATQFSLNSTSGAGLFFRREGGYVGTATLGRLWFGETDGALSRLNVGVSSISGDNEGDWNGGAQRFVNSAAIINYPFPVNSPFYGQGRIVYVSPVFAGFDFAASFEPNATVGFNSCPTGTIINNCTDPASLPAATANVAINQRQNTFDAAVRYRGSFGPAAVAAEIGTIQSGTVKTSGMAATASKTKGLAVYDFGATVTAFGVQVGGHGMIGDENGDNSLIRSGQKKQQAYILGATYTMGRLIVGVNYINELSAGNAIANAGGTITNGASQLHEIGLGLGASYDYAPGAELYVSGIYGTRHQNNINVQGGAGYTGNVAANKNGNSTTAHAIAIGNVFAF